MHITISDFPAKGSVLTGREIVELARAAEEAGMDRFAVTDFPFYRDCVPLMTACLEGTTRLAVESLVTNPFLRMPDVTACTWATMAELSGGRAILGIGKGGGVPPIFVAPWGYERPNPRVAVAELIAICRAMWAGEVPLAVGRAIGTSGLRLDFPLEHRVPILVAARGPKMLGVAARHADIVHVSSPFLAGRYVDGLLAVVDAAAADAGRSAADFEVDLTVSLCALDDAGQAQRLGRITTASAIVWLSKDADHAALDGAVPGELVTRLTAGWDMWSGEPLPDDLAAAIDDEVMREFTVAGDVAACREALGELIARFPRVTGLRLKLPSVTGPDSYRLLREMIENAGEVVAGAVAPARPGR